MRLLFTGVAIGFALVALWNFASLAMHEMYWPLPSDLDKEWWPKTYAMVVLQFLGAIGFAQIARLFSKK